ncbi:MAG: efflux RND transporter permease subunit [Sulfurospirillum sp.]
MVKRFITFAVEKSILNHIFLLFLIVLAFFSYQKIPKEIFPPSNLETISVTGFYAGASPDILDKTAVKPLEDELRNLNDMDRMESSVKNGFFKILIYLREGSNQSEVLDDVKDVISRVKKDFPSDMNEPIAKILKTSYPLATIAIASNQSKEKMLKVADELKTRLSKIKNLSDVAIRGDTNKELLIKIDENKLNAYHLSADEVASKLSSISSIYPIGLIKQRGGHLFVSTLSGEKNIQKLRDMPLTFGAITLRLKDIATANFQLADPNEVSHFNGKPNISVNTNKAKDGNAITLVKDIKKVLKKFKQKYKNYDFEVYTDTSIWIRNRLNTVISNIIFGLILVSLSVYIFISGRIAFIVGLGIPVSFFIGLITMNLMGYSLNMLSLLGALIALGMLVDEAIVVAENIYKHLECGESPKTAAINGASEMFPAVLTATATTIFAFLPLLIMSGDMGVFMRVLPIVISILLLSSLFEAFFFLPLHAKDFLKAKTKTKKNESWWNGWNRVYKSTLTFLLKYRKSFLAFFLIFTLVSTVYLFKRTNFQLFPDFDNTQIYISGKVNINYKLQETQELVTKVEKVLLAKLPKSEVSSITSISGFMLDAKFQPHMAENNFQIFINLHERKPKNFYNKYINPYLSPAYDDSDMKRVMSARELLEKIKKLTLQFEKSKNFNEFKVIVPGAGIVKSDVELAFSAKDDSVIENALHLVENKMKSIKGVFNIYDDKEAGVKEVKLRVNEYGLVLGFSERYIASLLRPYFFASYVNKMTYDKELINIVTQDINKDNKEALENFYVDIPGSLKKVRLSEIVDFEYKNSDANIYKNDGVRVSTIYASLRKKTITSAKLLERLKPIFEKIRNKGVKITIKGEEKENRKIQKEMAEAGVIAVFLIFIALVWMFDSITLCFVVLSTIPLSLLGVLVGHLIMDMNLTMPSLLGIVGLSGVVVNDGIIMIDSLKKAKSMQDILDFATKRLRPILLTSITTVLGLSTLMFFAAGQSVILQPMAISLGFGIAWATVLNLFYVPVLFVSIRRKFLSVI